MGSSRLPGKVMMDLCGRPMLAHILDRLKSVSNAEIVIVATSTDMRDDIVSITAEAEGTACFRGDERDVLDRYYQAATRFSLKHVVRATADNPFVDIKEIERLIALHMKSGADYTHAFGELPIGVGTECFTIEALTRSWHEGKAPNHREHVNEYIQERPGQFHIERLGIPGTKYSPLLRLTVDTPEDFERARSIYQALYHPGHLITTEEAIRACVTLSA